MSTENVDMYHDYPGHRIVAAAEIDQALTSALVVVDTNLLLNLYRYAEGTCDDLLGVLESLGSGVLPRDVQPCLRPEFDKEGIAQAFRIPAEMVDVLAGEEGA